MTEYNAKDDGEESYLAAIEAKRLAALAAIKREVVIGDCRLLLGDCLEILPAIGRVHAVIADLPYGTTQNAWDSVLPLQPLWTQLWGLVGRNGVIALSSAQPFTSVLVASQVHRFKYSWVWRKSRPTGHMNAKKQPLREHEEICVFYDGQPTYNPQFTVGEPNHVSAKSRVKSLSANYGKQYEVTEEATDRKYPKTILSFDVVSPTDVLHPTQKPAPLFEYLVSTHTNEGDTVLDPTMGSGTTGVACAKLGRKFVGIEKDPGYFDIACERIRKAYAQPDMFIEAARPPALAQEAML